MTFVAVWLVYYGLPVVLVVGMLCLAIKASVRSQRRAAALDVRQRRGHAAGAHALDD
ncbi:hypothetical protein [Cellulomonas sp. ATA003]|uniref:hypothetical protein n=1 Tax=Cellulomonas sp. ATA003 TaxID=3073064 RepID=UPI002872DED6|nr:hypothetical protein [Cellulomonas sp. ATA003]WNB84774.1 hypothetical protein REH70_13490 [Cellulomonas sp. ATA003]